MRLIVRISKDGKKVEAKVQNVIGPSCEEITKKIEDIYGKANKREYTDDYYKSVSEKEKETL